jgi:hypothetical protein
MYKYNFGIDFKNVSQSKGRHHIHYPEHISKAHKIGVPGFRITRVGAPRLERARVTIDFQCETFGKSLNVKMSSKSKNNSVLVFHEDSKNQEEPWNWALGASQFPLLCLEFNVDERDNGDSHHLDVTFSFWNQWLLPIVPLFPLFVFINSVEDYLYFNVFQPRENDTPQDPLFALYRLYILYYHIQSTGLGLN